MGVCIFSLSDDVPLAVSLEELYVLKEYRGNGYGRILLEEVIEELQKDKIRYVLYKKVSEKIDEVFECYDYAIKNGFVPSVIDEKILYYDIVSLLGRNFENKESEIKKELDKVVRFKDLSGEEIIRFNEKKDHGFYKIRLKSFDEKLTHFFMDKGGRLFTVALQGEFASDQGGPYHEVISSLCKELSEESVDLFIKSPNNRNDTGDYKKYNNTRERSRDKEEYLKDGFHY